MLKLPSPRIVAGAARLFQPPELDGWRLAQAGVICFGPRRGKKHTFVLLDEWIPVSKAIEREGALAELTRRYFAIHGPAIMRDFVWWSGMPKADAKQA